MSWFSELFKVKQDWQFFIYFMRNMYNRQHPNIRVVTVAITFEHDDKTASVYCDVPEECDTEYLRNVYDQCNSALASIGAPQG